MQLDSEIIPCTCPLSTLIRSWWKLINADPGNPYRFYLHNIHHDKNVAFATNPFSAFRLAHSGLEQSLLEFVFDDFTVQKIDYHLNDLKRGTVKPLFLGSQTIDNSRSPIQQSSDLLFTKSVSHTSMLSSKAGITPKAGTKFKSACSIFLSYSFNT